MFRGSVAVPPGEFLLEDAIDLYAWTLLGKVPLPRNWVAAGDVAVGFEAFGL